MYNDGALHQILANRPASRRMILTRIQELANNPFVTGDFEVSDASGRKNQVSVLHGFAITFWADHAVKELRIVDVAAFGRIA